MGRPWWLCLPEGAKFFIETLFSSHTQAYIEFFCSPENLAKLRALLPSYPSLSYQAVNLAGETEGNLKGVAAVTWGVWPGSQIKQPTVVDPDVFCNVWKVLLLPDNC